MEEQYQQIESLFIDLLQDENNSYNYASYYREQLDTSRFKEKSTLDKLLYFSTTITEEWTKCRRHENDSKASVYEKQILGNIKNLLQTNEWIAFILEKMNEEFRLQRELEQKFYGQSSPKFDVVLSLEGKTEIGDVYSNVFALYNILDSNRDKDEDTHRRLGNLYQIQQFLRVLLI